MATPTPTPRVLPVDIPTTPYKEEDETDAQIFRLVAERLDRSVTAPHGRLVAHRSGPARKKWFRNVSRVVITPCADKAAATATELELIQALNPVYNVQRFKAS